METWQDEIRRAVEAGEREFGFLDGHQTIKRNLLRRCQELLSEQLQPAGTDNDAAAPAAGEAD